jgi:aldose 1-epimerase
MSTDTILLQQDSAALVLEPAKGGAVREWRRGQQHLFRPTPAVADDDPFLYACFPMVPYANRIAHGRFTYGGHEVRIEPNWDGDPHPLHGQGWRASWSVGELSDSRAVLYFDGGGDEWPWRYRCQQLFELRPDGLSVMLSVQNLATTPMPAVIGLHPYFPDANHARLGAQVPRVWRTDDSLAVENIATPPAWRFEPSRSVAGVPLDHSFSDWTGDVDISWPDRRLRMRATNCAHLHIYTPSGRDFFCLEPQSAPAGALNRDGSELSILDPRGQFAIRVDFTVGAA